MPTELRVLLAEDNVVNRQITSAMLVSRGHSVDMVGNGREALSAVQRGRYDLVLMDLEMPELDGYEATRQILALPQCRGLAILALTAHATAEEKQRAEEAGMTGFLKKPCRPVELFESIENAIRKSGQTGDSRGDPGRSRTPENG